MKKHKQAFKLAGVSYDEYLAWCKKNNRAHYKTSSKREFFKRIFKERLARDSSGRLVVKRPRKKPMKVKKLDNETN